jgi:hypothetical protein
MLLPGPLRCGTFLPPLAHLAGAANSAGRSNRPAKGHPELSGLRLLADLSPRRRCPLKLAGRLTVRSSGSHRRTSLIGAVGTLVTSGPRPSRPDCEGSRGVGGPGPLRIRLEAETICRGALASRKPAGGEREALTETHEAQSGPRCRSAPVWGGGTPLRSRPGGGRLIRTADPMASGGYVSERRLRHR